MFAARLLGCWPSPAGYGVQCALCCPVGGCVHKDSVHVWMLLGLLLGLLFAHSCLFFVLPALPCLPGGDALERGNNVNTVIFDKTGTLTLGRPQVMEASVFSKHYTLQQVRASTTCGSCLLAHRSGGWLLKLDWSIRSVAADLWQALFFEAHAHHVLPRRCCKSVPSCCAVITGV